MSDPFGPKPRAAYEKPLLWFPHMTLPIVIDTECPPGTSYHLDDDDGHRMVAHSLAEAEKLWRGFP